MGRFVKITGRLVGMILKYSLPSMFLMAMLLATILMAMTMAQLSAQEVISLKHATIAFVLHFVGVLWFYKGAIRPMILNEGR